MAEEKSSKDLAEERTERAEERTDWAEDRTILANERTFAGWMRTGLGSVGVALGLRAVFGPFEPTWVAKGVATVFIATAMVIFWLARTNARKTIERMDSHTAEPLPPQQFTLVANLFTIAAAAVGIVLWLL